MTEKFSGLSIDRATFKKALIEAVCTEYMKELVPVLEEIFDELLPSADVPED
jgi:hypothetical protein